jgi:hypothetical protein
MDFVKEYLLGLFGLLATLDSGFMPLWARKDLLDGSLDTCPPSLDPTPKMRLDKNSIVPVTRDAKLSLQAKYEGYSAVVNALNEVGVKRQMQSSALPLTQVHIGRPSCVQGAIPRHCSATVA